MLVKLGVGLRVPHSTRRALRPLYPHPRTVETKPLYESSHVANIKSQIKRIGTNRKATERNKAYKSELRTAIRRVREAVAEGNAEQAQTALAHASKKLDKAVSKGVVHKNQAANRKSAIAKLVNGIAK